MNEILFLIFILSAFSIAIFLGKNRHIGFFWSMFLSLLLTPVVGLIITLFSPNKNEPVNNPSSSLVVIGRMMIVLFGALFLFITFGFGSAYISNQLFGILFSLGLFGLGVYIVKLGKCNFEKAK